VDLFSSFLKIFLLFSGLSLILTIESETKEMNTLYEKAIELNKLIEEQSEVRSTTSPYAYQSGIYSAILKFLPETPENITFIERQIELCKESIEGTK